MATSALKYPGISGYSGYSGIGGGGGGGTSGYSGISGYSGAALYGILTVTTDYTPLSSDDVILCDGTFTVSLSTAVDNPGKLYHIKNINTGTIIIDPNGTETIDGGLTATLGTQYECISIISDGNTWHII